MCYFVCLRFYVLVHEALGSVRNNDNKKKKHVVLQPCGQLSAMFETSAERDTPFKVCTRLSAVGSLRTKKKGDTSI